MFILNLLKKLMVVNLLLKLLLFLAWGVWWLSLFPVPWLLATRERVEHFATNRRFWFLGPYVDRFRWPIGFLSAAAGIALALFSYTRLLPAAFATSGEVSLVPLGGWVLGSLVGGVLILPMKYLLVRRRIYRDHIWDKHSNTAHDRDTAFAIHRGNNARIAFEDGYAITADNSIRSLTDNARVAPEYEGQVSVIGRVNRPLRGLGVKSKDRNLVKGWVDGQKVIAPPSLSMTRVICMAESGAGKSDFLLSIAAAYTHRGVRITLVDWKADSRDAERFAKVLGVPVTDTRYRVFEGTLREIIDERLFGIVYPASGGDGDHYRLESIQYVRDLISYGGKVQSLNELIDRIRIPALHLPYDPQLRKAYSNEKKNEQVAADTYNRLQIIEPYITDGPNQGWSWWENTGSRVLPMRPEEGQKKIGVMMLRDLKRYVMDYRDRKERGEPVGEELIIIDEFPQMVSEDSDPAAEAAGLFELVRSAEGIGLIIATQTPEGLSADEPMQRRLMSSGATIFAGRSSNPRLVSELSGVTESEVKDMDADVGATGSRFVAPNVAPEWVRKASMGEFAIIQSGAYEWVRIWRASDDPAVEISDSELVTASVDQGGFF